MRNYVIVASSVFALQAIGHLIRLVRQTPLQFGDWSVPVGGSAVALVVIGALSAWGFMSLRRR
jgi:hypothetical protein